MRLVMASSDCASRLFPDALVRPARVISISRAQGHVAIFHIVDMRFR